MLYYSETFPTNHQIQYNQSDENVVELTIGSPASKSSSGFRYRYLPEGSAAFPINAKHVSQPIATDCKASRITTHHFSCIVLYCLKNVEQTPPSPALASFRSRFQGAHKLKQVQFLNTNLRLLHGKESDTLMHMACPWHVWMPLHLQALRSGASPPRASAKDPKARLASIWTNCAWDRGVLYCFELCVMVRNGA